MLGGTDSVFLQTFLIICGPIKRYSQRLCHYQRDVNLGPLENCQTFFRTNEENLLVKKTNRLHLVQFGGLEILHFTVPE